MASGFLPCCSNAREMYVVALGHVQCHHSRFCCAPVVRCNRGIQFFALSGRASNVQIMLDCLSVHVVPWSANMERWPSGGRICRQHWKCLVYWGITSIFEGFRLFPRVSVVSYFLNNSRFQESRFFLVPLFWCLYINGQDSLQVICEEFEIICGPLDCGPLKLWAIRLWCHSCGHELIHSLSSNERSFSRTARCVALVACWERVI